jgi:hypothetical protein
MVKIAQSWEKQAMTSRRLKLQNRKPRRVAAAGFPVRSIQTALAGGL